MLPPNLPERLTDESLEEAASRAAEEGNDLEACRFYGENLPDLAGETVEFSGCRFEKCVFRPCGAERLVYAASTASAGRIGR